MPLNDPAFTAIADVKSNQFRNLRSPVLLVKENHEGASLIVINSKKGRIHMTFQSLKDVYIDQMQDLYSADLQALPATRKLGEKASNSELKDALERSCNGIEKGMEILSSIIKGHEADPRGECCKGMEGIVKEVHDHALDADFGNDDVRDAVIITQVQRMTHYALAGYGCAVSFARRLELNDEADQIQKQLDNIYEGDRVMTRIAEGAVNAAAA